MMVITHGGEASRGVPLKLRLIFQFLKWMVKSAVSSHFAVMIHNSCNLYIIVYMLYKILKQETARKFQI